MIRFVRSIPATLFTVTVASSCVSPEAPASGTSVQDLDEACAKAPLAPALFYPLEVDATGAVIPEAIRGLDAVIAGGPLELVDGQSPLGPTLFLPGGASLRTADAVVLDGGTAFAAAAWVSPSDAAADATIIARGVAGTAGAWRLDVAAAPDAALAALRFTLCDPRQCTTSELPDAVPAGQASLVAASARLVGAGDTPRELELDLRVAGVPGDGRRSLAKRSTVPVDLASFDGDAGLVIGAHDAVLDPATGEVGPVDDFVGALDQLLVWDAAIDQATFDAVAAATSGTGVCVPPPPPPPPPPTLACNVAAAAVADIETPLGMTATYAATNCPGCTVEYQLSTTGLGAGGGYLSLGGSSGLMAPNGTYTTSHTWHSAPPANNWRLIGPWLLTFNVILRAPGGQVAATCQDNHSFRLTDLVPPGTWCGRTAAQWQLDVDNRTIVLTDFSAATTPQTSSVLATEPHLIIGGAAGDTLTGGDLRDCIYGNGGADEIDGGATGDWLDGGLGNDTIRGRDGADTIYGGPGDDTLRGDADGDTIFGDANDDTIDGDDGADHLHGGPGNDTIHGDVGNDTIWGDDGDDTLRGDGEGDEIHGGAGNDDIDGDANNDVLYGDGDDDTIKGSGGDDTIYCGPGRDKAKGGDGNDYIEGGPGDDFLKGDGAGDTLFGGDDDDRICGGSDIFSTNYINGDAGTDSCRGGNPQYCEGSASATSCNDSHWNSY